MTTVTAALSDTPTTVTAALIETPTSLMLHSVTRQLSGEDSQHAKMPGCKDCEKDIVYALGCNYEVEAHRSHLNACNIVKDGEEDIV